MGAIALATTAVGSSLLPGAAAATPGSLRPATAVAAAGHPDFGPNVIVFDPTMPTSAIQARVDAIATTQVSNQFGRQRYALLFRPGRYGTPAQPLVFQVGYYTEVAGLGAAPGDVTLNGQVDVYNQCLPAARRREQLHGADQLLALALQPDDQRVRCSWLPGVDASSGRSPRPRRCGGCRSPAASSP